MPTTGPSHTVIIYEVSLTVESEVADAFAAWLPGHIKAMLTLPGFMSAELQEVMDGPDDGRVRWCVRYALKTEKHLERYYDEFAEQMRGDGIARFGGNFEAHRRVLRPFRQFAALPAPGTAARKSG